jgi:arginyl-tRNA synthetase
VHLLLEQRLQQAVAAVLPDANPSAVLVRPCPDPKFGDYQSNALIALAKLRKLNPRQLASDVLAKLDVSEWCERVEIAGAGFLNFHLRTAAIGQALLAAHRGEHLFFQRAAHPRRIVIDFSSPNVAKPMHVGHIRSTILGDSLARTLRVLGHEVITDNHIGDWGTQFGMLLVGWKTELNPSALATDALAELERIYKSVSARCDEEKPGFDPALRERARAELVQLQGGDAENVRIWREIIRLSQGQFDTIYARLGVKFDHTLGESFYNPRLKETVESLQAQGVATESEGALCVFSDGTVPPKEDPFLIQKEGKMVPNPLVVRKRDGGFNYATTDLATLIYRTTTWNPHDIVYVTDGRQQQHFRQFFAAFRRWRPELAARVQLVHVWFGTILGEDNKPFKTRDGDTVKLAALLDEAEERAFKIVTEKNPELPEGTRRRIATVVGLGAVKYADLLPNRQSDYVFSWDRMLAFNGNTAVYLLYSYARVRSVSRKGEASSAEQVGNRDLQFHLTSPYELALAKKLLGFGLVLDAVAEEYRPNFLCNYLYDLAGLFSGFWENCPVLKAEPEERTARLALCELTGRVLRQGLELLGIQALEQM